MTRRANFLIGFSVGWLVYVVESMFCATAYGGPFTVFTGFLLLPFMAVVISGVFTGTAWLIGLLLRLPRVRDVWELIGYWSILLVVAAACLMIFASELGLRNADPVTGYKKMPLWLWSVCFFSILFPIVNLPLKRRPIRRRFRSAVNLRPPA